MAQDRDGKELREGDRVTLECVVTHVGQFGEHSVIMEPHDPEGVHDEDHQPRIHVDGRVLVKAEA
jgi:hypothetical protein